MTDNYKVTVKNDASVRDGQGAVHTWLVVTEPGGKTRTISYTLGAGGAVTNEQAGSFDNEAQRERKPTEEVTFNITQEQAQAMIKRWGELEKTPPNYDALPDGDGDGNCVTVASDILKAGGVDYLVGIQDPYGVENKIEGSSPWMSLGDALKAKDSLDNGASDAWEWIKDKMPGGSKGGAAPPSSAESGGGARQGLLVVSPPPRKVVRQIT